MVLVVQPDAVGRRLSPSCSGGGAVATRCDRSATGGSVFCAGCDDAAACAGSGARKRASRAGHVQARNRRADSVSWCGDRECAADGHSGSAHGVRDVSNPGEPALRRLPIATERAPSAVALGSSPRTLSLRPAASSRATQRLTRRVAYCLSRPRQRAQKLFASFSRKRGPSVSLYTAVKRALRSPPPTAPRWAPRSQAPPPGPQQ